MNNIIPYNTRIQQCQTGNRCQRFKHCEPCARIRQAKIADCVELASRFTPNATYAVVMPYEQKQSNIKLMRSRIIRKFRKSVDGMFCSVEASANNALHLNLILLSDRQLTPNILQQELRNINSEGSIFMEKIEAKSETDTKTQQIRRITAYSLKRQNIPTAEIWHGNTITSTGTIKTMRNIMQSKRMRQQAPMVALVSMHNTLRRLGLHNPKYAESYTENMQDMLGDFADMLAQLEQGKICYSERYGALSESDFRTLWNRDVLGL